MIGLIILVGGLGSAMAIWLAQDRIDREEVARRLKNPGSANVLDPLSPDDSRRYTRDVELYYGKTGLLVDKWTRGLQRLTHGKPLAAAISAGSVAAAAVLLLVATAYHPEEPA